MGLNRDNNSQTYCNYVGKHCLLGWAVISYYCFWVMPYNPTYLQLNIFIGDILNCSYCVYDAICLTKEYLPSLDVRLSSTENICSVLLVFFCKKTNVSPTVHGNKWCIIWKIRQMTIPKTWRSKKPWSLLSVRFNYKPGYKPCDLL